MRGRSVLEVCVAEGGVLKGARVATYIAQWAMCAADLGRQPGMEEFISWWGEPRRTVYRQQAEFRQVFPGHDTPQVIAEQLLEQVGVDDQAQAVAALGSLQVA